MTETTDIEKLMEQIREVVEENSPDRPAITYIDEMGEDKENPRDFIGVEEEAEITKTSAASPVPAGPISVFIKKLMKKTPNFVGAPTPMRVNSFHLLLIRIINEQDLKIKNTESALIEERERIKELSLRLAATERKIDKLLKRSEGTRLNTDGIIDKNSGAAIKALTNFDYISFEDEFRGPEDQIKERQSGLIRFFSGKKNVLDIGCGRGEFLESLRENKIRAQGIDADDDMVGRCQKKGLQVAKGDALIYLGEQKDGFFDGIFLGQVVEHLAPADLLKLIELCYFKLEKNGYLVMETINPLCLSVFANSFYLDITHQQPVHPQFLNFQLRSLGFMDIEMILMSPVDEGLKLKKLIQDKNDHNKDINVINDNLEKLNNLLFSYQDYAIAAKK